MKITSPERNVDHLKILAAGRRGDLARSGADIVDDGILKRKIHQVSTGIKKCDNNLMRWGSYKTIKIRSDP